MIQGLAILCNLRFIILLCFNYVHEVPISFDVVRLVFLLFYFIINAYSKFKIDSQSNVYHFITVNSRDMNLLIFTSFENGHCGPYV